MAGRTKINVKVAAAIGAYNEEKDIAAVIESLLAQTHPVEQITITDDGSTDRTAEIIKKFERKYPKVAGIYQENAGPAAARNRAWRAAPKDADVIAFTDGNTIPEKTWLEELVKPFRDPGVGGAGGAYKTLNTESVLARFFGLEIEWKYSRVTDEIDAHGTYNLAVRRDVLEEIGGFDETYKKPSGEDWDMTYKVSRRYKLVFVPSAVVGTEHPENVVRYLKTQKRRGYDRIMLYQQHPEMGTRDNYTGKLVKYQVWISGMLIPSLIFLYPFFPYCYVIPAVMAFFLFATALLPFPYFLKRDPAVAFASIPIQLARNYAWFIGMVQGMFKFGFFNIVRGVLKSGM